MTAQEFEAAKRAVRYRAKGTRVQPLIDPDGKRWVWVASRGYWAHAELSAKPEPPMFRNSKTICENRNKRRLAMGYTDTYSLRERGWPYAVRNGKPD